MLPQVKSTVPPLGETVFRVGGGVARTHVYRVVQCPRKDTKPRTVRCRCTNPRSCAECSRGWAVREAHKAVHRMEHLFGDRKPRHVVVSWPAVRRVVDEPTFKRARRQAIETLRRMGAEGGAVVLHPWRHRAVGGCTKWYAGLHVHAIVYGRVDAERRPAGTFVRTLRKGQKSVLNTLSYLLDHGGFYYRGHAVAWFGRASYNAGGPTPKAPDAPMRCDRCGSVLEVVTEWSLSRAMADELVVQLSGGGP